MPKYRVSWTEESTYAINGLVEADDEDQARDIAFEEGYDFECDESRMLEVFVVEEEDDEVAN